MSIIQGDLFIVYFLDNNYYLSYYIDRENTMSIDKRKLLWIITEKELWKNLSSEEVRLYFLLLIFADISNGEGKISWKDISYYLAPHFCREKLKKTIQNLEKLHLVKINFSVDKSEIGYKILSEEK